MKKPKITMLKKGSRLRTGDIIVRDDGVFTIKKDGIAHGRKVHGPEDGLLTEGYYFRITWE